MDKKKLEKFPPGVLEHVSKTMGGWCTGSEIGRLLRVAGYPERSEVVGTKWRYLYALFDEFNEKPNGQYDIVKIIQAFCDPTQWISQENNRKQAMNTLNEGLTHVDLQLNENGRIVVTQGRISHIVKKEEVEKVKTELKLMTVAPVFRAREVKTEENLCFILMPFRASFDRLYRDKIKPTVEACGFKCLRADDLFSPTSIIEDIWTHICKSKVIIADVTGRNPNVFYEIGVAHTVGKPVIIVTQEKADIPFDVAQFRYFVYSDDALGWDTLCRNITSALRTVTLQDYES